MESKKSRQQYQRCLHTNFVCFDKFSAGEILPFIEGLQTKAQMPPNEEKF